ncbi:peritrophin-48-like isoform X2 [Physella acuta]|uniref:peritrophin-48-like isoform X2 n=1 Tax=Physella acuta TaxID=109671 RepID=UPI0027DC2CB5|nr:peritrophin-48-like isoform X2 [Physella acuta]
MCIPASRAGEYNPCEGRADGWVAEVYCWGYRYCQSNQLVNHTCAAGEVWDRDTKQCVQPGAGTTDCGLQSPCLGKADGFYPDLTDHCISYFVCAGEKLLGRQYCPSNLVFDASIDACDWKSNVASPCGTKV